MSDALGTAIIGLNHAGARIANAASNIVNASSTSKNNFDPSLDIASNLIAVTVNKTDYAANAAVVKAVKKNNETLEHALDIHA